MSEQSNRNLEKESSIIMVGCFDTKGEDFGYLYSSLEGLGVKVIAVNTGVLGSTDLFPINFEADEVALKGGSTLTDLRKNKDRGRAIEAMGNGAATIVLELYNKKKSTWYNRHGAAAAVLL